MIKNTPEYKPLYKQVYEILHKRIINSEYKINKLIPSEKQLSKEFEVSVSTIRQAVGLLIEDGLLIRKQGKGTFVTDNSIQISFLGWVGEMKEGQRVIKKIIAIFEENNPNLKVNYINCSYEDIKKEYINLVRSGNSPDVVQIDNNWTSNLASMGLLESLEELVDNRKTDYLFGNNGFNGGIYNDKYYSIFWGLGPSALMYNRKLIEKFNINLEGEITLDDFMNICRQITKSSVKDNIYSFGLATNIDILYNIYTFLLGFDADIIDNNNNIVLDNNEAIEAFKWLKKLIKYCSIIWTDNIRDLRKVFANNKLVFIEDGPWMRGILKNLTGYNDIKTDEHFGVIENPVGGNSTYSSFARNHSLAISSMSDNKEGAITFVDFLTSNIEISKLFFEDLGLLSPHDNLLKSHKKHPYYKPFINQLKRTRVLNSKNPLFGKALKFVADAFYNILYCDYDIKKELEEKAYYLRMLYDE